MNIRVINLRHVPRDKPQENLINISRMPHPGAAQHLRGLGNPYRPSESDAPGSTLPRYTQLLKQHLMTTDASPMRRDFALLVAHARAQEQSAELQLGCWCADPKMCHARIVARALRAQLENR